MTPERIPRIKPQEAFQSRKAYTTIRVSIAFSYFSIFPLTRDGQKAKFIQTRVPELEPVRG